MGMKIQGFNKKKTLEKFYFARIALMSAICFFYFPSKECHTCKKCQQGFKSLPTQMNHVWSQHCILLSDSTTPLKEKVPH